LTAPGARVAVLHPGAMGAALGRQLADAGVEVAWCADGRGPATHERAAAAGLRELPSLAEVCGWATVVLSVCPPHAALDLARAVAAEGFAGLYADLNAVAPQRMDEIAAAVTRATVVDGCLIGPPPAGGATVSLQLAGDADAVATVAGLFAGTDVRARAVAPAVGAASALKMAYATYTKGSLALAALAQALARRHGVLDALDGEWDELPGGSPAASLSRSAAAAWRWSGELHEIAQAMAAAGLPPEALDALAAVYERWDAHRDDRDVPRATLLDEL
jgi:3-hydroxyisobutyrate dehydrogenase-like beta-hydroxyacid dehydrogenase